MTIPITQGQDFNFFQRLTISAISFADNSDVFFNFKGNPSFSLINEGSVSIEYSFNGNTKHGDLVPGPSSAETFSGRGVSSIWFRAPSGSSIVRVEAFPNGSITSTGTTAPVATDVSALATSANQTNGTQKTIVRGGEKGSTVTNADITHTASGVNHEGLDVIIYDVSGNPITTFGTPGAALDTTLTTRLPAAAALADGVANPTLTEINVFEQVFNGTTWDRARSGLVTAQTAATGMQNILPTGKYNATPLALSDTQLASFQLNSEADLKVAESYASTAENNTDGIIYVLNRPLATSSGAWSKTSSAAAGNLAAGVVIKASPGRVRRISVTNSNATTAFFFQLFDLAVLPTSTSTLATDRVFCHSATIAATTGAPVTQIMDFGEGGLYCATGITIAASSTIDVFTVLGAKDSNSMVISMRVLVI